MKSSRPDLVSETVTDRTHGSRVPTTKRHDSHSTQHPQCSVMEVLLLAMESPSSAPSRLRQRSSSGHFPSFTPTSYISLRQRRASTVESGYLSNKSLVKSFRTRTPRRNQRKMPILEAHYHPFLFTMMTLSAMAELGLTSFLISAGNENGTWPSPRYHAL